MEFFTIGQLVGYLGTFYCLLAAGIIAKLQRTNTWFWLFVLLGNVLWINAGYLQGSFSVIIDVLAFMPIHIWGVIKFLRQKRLY